MKSRAFPIYAEFLHHAYCITGDREAVREELFLFIEEELGIQRIGNPDFYHEQFDTLGIDDARGLSDRQLQKSFSGTKKIFVITARDITREAQNALLKLFEEPTAGTHFFLILDEADLLLPTLRSRLFLVEREAGRLDDANAKKFLKMSVAERFSFAKKFADRETARMDLVVFLDALISEARPHLLEKKTADLKDGMEILLRARHYATDRAASVKYVFDMVATALPVMK